MVHNLRGELIGGKTGSKRGSKRTKKPRRGGGFDDVVNSTANVIGKSIGVASQLMPLMGLFGLGKKRGTKKGKKPKRGRGPVTDIVGKALPMMSLFGLGKKGGTKKGGRTEELLAGKRRRKPDKALTDYQLFIRENMPNARGNTQQEKVSYLAGEWRALKGGRRRRS